MSRNLNKILNYSLLKISFIPIMLWIISSLVFILLRVAPGDPVDAILGSGADEVSREFLRNKLGLDEPLISQYFSYIKNLLHLDFGQSLSTQEPVLNIINTDNDMDNFFISFYFIESCSRRSSRCHTWIWCRWGFKGISKK